MDKNSKTFAIAVKAIIFNKADEYLILKKSLSEEINPGTFDLPGGRVKFGENLIRAIKREVREETGYVIRPLHAFNAWSFRRGDINQLIGIDFISKITKGRKRLSSEHAQLRWLGIQEIKNTKVFPKWLVDTIDKADKIRKALMIK